MDVASGWAGAAFAKFTFSIPEGHSITEATLTWACTQYGGSVYTSNIYYLNAGSDFDFDNATTASDTWRMTDSRTLIETHAQLQGVKNTGKLHTDQITDITEALKAINDAGQNYITFQWTANNGSAQLKGKGSAEYAPTLTITTADAASVTSYTVRFQDADGNTIKEDATYTGVAIGSTATASAEDIASFFNEDKSKKYIYASGNEEITTVADAASNVITLKFREAGEFNYSLKTNGGAELASGKNFEGETILVNYPRFILADGTLSAAAKATAGWYLASFELTEDNQVETINYTASVENVVYYAEAEDITGLTVSTALNSDIRCSNGKCAYNATDADLAITTLPAGKYTLSTSSWGGEGVTFVFKAGSETILSFDCMGYILDQTSNEFTVGVGETATIYLAATSVNSKGIDFVYITKTGEATGIADVEADGAAADDTLYDLMGRKVQYSKGLKGIYIRNGKKVMFR